MNLSNTVDFVKGEIAKPDAGTRISGIKSFVNLPFVKKILLAIYDQIFKWYYA